MADNIDNQGKTATNKTGLFSRFKKNRGDASIDKTKPRNNSASNNATIKNIGTNSDTENGTKSIGVQTESAPSQAPIQSSPQQEMLQQSSSKQGKTSKFKQLFSRKGTNTPQSTPQDTSQFTLNGTLEGSPNLSATTTDQPVPTPSIVTPVIQSTGLAVDSPTSFFTKANENNVVPPDARQTVAQAQTIQLPKKNPGKIRRALSRTGKGISNVFLGKKTIDDELFEALETQLLTADLGVEVTTEVISTLTDKVKRKQLDNVAALYKELSNILTDILKPCEKPLQISAHKPYTLLMVGVNGVGKTTTIGKLAKQFAGEGNTVMLAAGDTFRAAAVEQLQAWGDRNQVPVVAQHTGADSASVIYDAVASAKAKSVDVLIADTAGRLHTKDNLMEELKKIKRVVNKVDLSAPHEIILVLDAGTGQNAVTQMQQFHQAVGITGIVLTKLDGTAKGGVIFALCQKFGVPIRYIGVGENAEDLRAFNAEEFVSALLDHQA